MKRVEKSIILIILPVFLAFSAWAAAGKLRLTLPVRVWVGKSALTGLQKEGFTLRIDDREREIQQVISRTVSLGQRPEFLGRNFILSFHMTEYGNHVQEALSYFITEIVGTADSLILVTPSKIYRFNVTANKEKMIGEVEELVKGDCDEFRKQLSAAEKNLEIQVHRLMQQLSMGIDTDPGLVASYKTIGTFLSTFPQEFMSFRNRYLFPQVETYRQVLDFLGNREGQRWWIHFQQGDSYGIVGEAYQAAKKIDSYCNLYELARQSFRTNLQFLEKQLQLADSFPGPQLLKIFMGGSIRYNVLLWEQRQRGENTPQSDIMAQLAAVLQPVSRDSGGKLVHTTGPEQGMKQLKDHRDHFYELAYDFDGSAGEKKIAVTAAAGHGKGVSLSYKHHYNAGEVRSLVEDFSRERVQIVDFSLNKNLLHFSIESITLDEKKTFGLVRVRVELFNRGGEGVYRTENTLRSSRRGITVSIPLSPQHKGLFKLVITACDLIANGLTVMEKEVELE